MFGYLPSNITNFVQSVIGLGELERPTSFNLTMPVIGEIPVDYLNEDGKVTVEPNRRIGKAILTALESQAKTLGASRLVLEAGDRQPEALTLYRRSGFSENRRGGCV